MSLNSARTNFTSSQDGHSMSLGFGTTGDDAAVGWTSEDGAATSNTSSVHDDDKIFLTLDQATGAVTSQGDMQSFDSDGFTINQTQASDASAQKICYFVMASPGIAGADSVGLVNGGLVNNSSLVSGGGLIN